MCVLDVIPCMIFIVICILHARPLLQSVLWVFIRDMMALLTLEFLCRSSSLQGLQGKNRRSSRYRSHMLTPVLLGAWWDLEVPGMRGAMFSSP